MKRLIFTSILTLFGFSLVPVIVQAAKPTSTNNKESVGYDISWPQCGKKLPTNQAFGIVGVNGGTAANTNPCLASQLVWANKSTGSTSQPKVQLYVNTGNPGELIGQITTWPVNNTDKTGYTPNNPYGICFSRNDLACSWQYGWNRAVEDYLDRLLPVAPNAQVSDYVWWLDVETINSWQSGSAEALSRNAATLEGMASYFKSKGATVGLYSTAYQWGQIAGQVSSTSILNDLPNWRPGSASLENAKSNCTLAPLTSGGFVSMTQYVQQNLDKNHSCL